MRSHRRVRCLSRGPRHGRGRVDRERDECQVETAWWLILVIVLVLLAVIGVGVWLFRRSEQKRRRAHTARFAKDLGDKEVRLVPPATPSRHGHSLTRFVTHRSTRSSPPSLSRSPTLRSRALRPQRPRTSSPSRRSPPRAATHRTTSRSLRAQPPRTSSSRTPRRPSRPTRRALLARLDHPGRGGQDADSRWSLSSYGSRIAPAPARRVEPQETGASVYSQRTFVTQAGNTLTIQSRNPFIGRM